MPPPAGGLVRESIVDAAIVESMEPKTSCSVAEEEDVDHDDDDEGCGAGCGCCFFSPILASSPLPFPAVVCPDDEASSCFSDDAPAAEAAETAAAA